jgi:hypothetical protein
VTVRIRRVGDKGPKFSGHGTDTDILVASTRGYVAALNKAALAAGLRPAEPGTEAEGVDTGGPLATQTS